MYFFLVLGAVALDPHMRQVPLFRQLAPPLLASQPPALAPAVDDLPSFVRVLSANVYLLHAEIFGLTVTTKPDINQRVDGLARWFGSLDAADVPDAVVLQEVMAAPGARLMRSLCGDHWKSSMEANVTQCEPGKLFGYASASVYRPGYVSLEGGVVVLSRAGLTLSDVRVEPFSKCTRGTADCFAQKGYVSARVECSERQCETWRLVGTHLQAWPEGQPAREFQAGQIGAHVAELRQMGDHGLVVVAGDFNAETKGELDPLFVQLAASNPGFAPRGFWLPSTADIGASFQSGAAGNLYPDPGQASKVDFVLMASGSAHAPVKMRWQYLALKAERCFPTELEPGITTDDLSDHYAVYAELCRGSHCPAGKRLAGHLGAAADSGNCCPGRAVWPTKPVLEPSTSVVNALPCFDWAPGAALADQLRLGPSQTCEKACGSGWCSIVGVGTRGRDEPWTQAASLEDCFRRLARSDTQLASVRVAASRSSLARHCALSLGALMLAFAIFWAFGWESRYMKSRPLCCPWS